MRPIGVGRRQSVCWVAAVAAHRDHEIGRLRAIAFSLRRRLISLPTSLRTRVMLAKARAATGQVIESIAILQHPGLECRKVSKEATDFGSRPCKRSDSVYLEIYISDPVTILHPFGSRWTA